MPLLSIKAPAYIRENISEDLQSQIERMQAYSEQNLHISIACIDYNPENAALIFELIDRIEAVLPNAIPEQIILEKPKMFNHSYFGYPLKPFSNESLEKIFNAVKEIVSELRKQFGDNEIRIIEWKPYQAHLTIFGQITENLELTESDDQAVEPFIPRSVVLRDNATIIHEFKAGNRRQELKAKADEACEKAEADFQAFRENTISSDFMSIRGGFERATFYYKNLDQPNERIACLINLGELNELNWQNTYNRPGFYSNDPNRFNYRIRRVEYALEIIRTLASLNVNGLSRDSIIPNLTQAQSYLEETKQFLNAIKKDANYQQELHINKLDSALEQINAGLHLLSPDKPADKPDESRPCVIM